MKKINILSMQEVDNYGSVLQAYSLKKMIESLGNEVGFLKIERGENEILNLQCLKDNFEKQKDNWIVAQWRRVKGKVEGRKHRKMFSKFRSDYKLIASEKEENGDVCVIGSDEVFNCLQKSKWGFSSQLFGDVKFAEKVITYAASCGSTKVDNLSYELRKAIEKSMTNISAISVRDENTAKFAEILTGKKIVFNLDPVAVGDFNDEIMDVSVESKLPSKYCIVYSYSERFDNSDEIRAISDYCKVHGLKIVAPFGKQKWIHSYEVLTPFELLKAFQRAECIVTDTFHGTLFGAKFGKRMAIVIRESNRNKLEDLTRRLQIQDHVVTHSSQLSVILGKELNKKKIDRILSQERLRTLEYLKENL